MKDLPPIPPERITMRSLIQSVIETFDVNKGWIKTYRLLTTRPGKTMRTYLLEDRSVLTKPFKLLIVSTAAVVFLMFKLIPEGDFVEGFLAGRNASATSLKQDSTAVDTSTINAPMPNEGTGQARPEETKTQNKKETDAAEAKKFFALFNQYYNVFMLLSLPFMALATSWFFGRKKYNYAEQIIFNAYVLSYQNFIMVILLPLFIWDSNPWTWACYMLCAYIYFFYAAKRFFEVGTWKAFWRSCWSIFLGTLMYMIAAMIIVTIIVFIYIKFFRGE